VTPLEAKLGARIAEHGPLSFREVMEAALYDPEFGYYTRLRGFGAEGDFITSPERHPAFGWLLGHQALDVWHALGEPHPFRILEIGGGSGALAASLLRSVRSEASEVVYCIDERSPSLQGVQQERLTDRAFRWDAPAEPAHFLIANEVADALPVTRGVVRGGRIHELLVTIEDRHLTWTESEAPHGELETYFGELHYAPPEGSVVDVCLELESWLRSLNERMARKSVALILDYAASPPRDSLLTYYRHTMGSDPLVRLGEQDVTAHVDLRTLVRLAIAQGLRAGATLQRGLLLNLGLQQVMEALPGPTDRRALGELSDPDGLGGKIAALFVIKGLPEYRPVGAVGRTDWPESKDVPSLPPDADEQDFLDQWREAFGAQEEHV
jgi:SAM-dependent MidA family methyltransferase